MLLFPAIALLTIRSLLPFSYDRPVSMKFIPFSRAYFINDSSFVQDAPKQIGLTSIPFLPKLLKSGRGEVTADNLFEPNLIPAIPDKALVKNSLRFIGFLTMN